MYRPPAASSRSGPGVSKEGFEGAETFFDSCKTVATDINVPGMPGGTQEAAAAKAAVDAYMAARGSLPLGDAFVQGTRVPGSFPDVDLKGDATPLSEIGKAVSELMSHMGDMLNQIVQGPMGILGSIFAFLLKLFSTVAENIGQALSETAQAVASAVEDAWKKQMEMASNSANSSLQPLELYNQSATTQTLGTSLKNSST